MPVIFTVVEEHPTLQVVELPVTVVMKDVDHASSTVVTAHGCNYKKCYYLLVLRPHYDSEVFCRRLLGATCHLSRSVCVNVYNGQC